MKFASILLGIAVVAGLAVLGARQWAVLQLEQAFVTYHHGMAERVLAPRRTVDSVPTDEDVAVEATALAAELGLELLDHSVDRRVDRHEASGSGHVDRVRRDLAAAQEASGHDVDAEGNVVAAPPTTTVLDRTNVYLWVHLRGRGFLCEATKELEVERDFARR